MLKVLDAAGDLPATAKEDHITQQHNLGFWLEKMAPANDNGALMMLSNAAIRNAVNDVNCSNVTKDVLPHPENYDAKTKTAALLKLSDLHTRMELSGGSGTNADLFNKYTAPHHGLNPNKDKATGQIDEAINILSSDPGMQQFLNQQQLAGMHGNRQQRSRDQGRPATLRRY